ncbi:MAG TPA: DUF1385 domain-containing protein [Dehalococcoidia bacterium]|nr:DUF1385 domain-containing protein [Dehalococcoidia bacterium]
MAKEFHYGGQAVIEGVMMRGQRSMAVAVRSPSGQVHVSTKPISNSQTGIRKVPFVRGVIVLVESLVLGIGALFESANISLGEEDQKISGPLLWGTLAASFAFAAAVFFVIPLLVTDSLVDPHINSSVLSNLVEGIIRVVIFLVYLALVNLIPDIRTVFAYHGAEHKTINAFEHHVPLEPEPVARFSTAHVRCGTSFLFAVMIIAIIVFSLVPSSNIWVRIVSRIVLIPVIAAVGYEFTRFSARYAENRIVRVLFLPGLALQKMTTRQPNNGQLEVAITALKGAIEADQKA